MKITSIRNLAAVVRTAARGVADSFGKVVLAGGLFFACCCTATYGQNPDSASDFNSDILLPKGKAPGREQIITRKSYVVSYNPDTRQPNWSAWHLTAAHADGPYKRKQLRIDGNYLEDELSVKGRQRLDDWQGTGGYDHGHMCPSGDNKWSLEAMRQTFFLSNMCVQNSALNQGPWEHLESTCRQWAKKYGDIHIVCGPIYYSTDYRKAGHKGRLTIPDAFFKVVMRAGPNPQAIGFIYENVSPAANDKISSHVVSVDEVERITGLDFFPTLPKKIEKEIEAHPDLSQWRTY